MEQAKQRLNEKNWALLDIEYIQCTRTHKCIRKLYILAKDGYTDLKLEFFPCQPFPALKRRYQRAFRYCQQEIHKLSYYPEEPSSPCSTAAEKLKKFIVDNEIDLVLYKGGIVEKNLCDELDIDSFNIELFEEDLEKVYSHDPYEEVNCYFIQLIEFIL